MLLVVVWAILKGHIRTSQEILAYKERNVRAESQVDTLLPLINKVVDGMVALSLTVNDVAAKQRDQVLPSLEELKRTCRERGL